MLQQAHLPSDIQFRLKAQEAASQLKRQLPFSSILNWLLTEATPATPYATFPARSL
jgi:hypothetical protein